MNISSIDLESLINNLDVLISPFFSIEELEQIASPSLTPHPQISTQNSSKPRILWFEIAKTPIVVP